MSSTTGPATTGPATTGPASPPARAAAVRVGMFAPFGLLEQGPEAARAFLADVGQAGIDHICCGDHVSFGGAGFDGLVQATALAMLHPALPVHCGVYLLPRSEEHTSELQSQFHLVCRLLLEKKNNQ